MTDKIILCTHCKGRGKIACSERIDYHHRIDAEWDIICTKCNGTGRLVEITEITYRALKLEELFLRQKPNEFPMS